MVTTQTIYSKSKRRRYIPAEIAIIKGGINISLKSHSPKPHKFSHESKTKILLMSLLISSLEPHLPRQILHVYESLVKVAISPKTSALVHTEEFFCEEKHQKGLYYFF